MDYETESRCDYVSNKLHYAMEKRPVLSRNDYPNVWEWLIAQFVRLNKGG